MKGLSQKRSSCLHHGITASPSLHQYDCKIVWCWLHWWGDICNFDWFGIFYVLKNYYLTLKVLNNVWQERSKQRAKWLPTNLERKHVTGSANSATPKTQQGRQRTRGRIGKTWRYCVIWLYFFVNNIGPTYSARIRLCVSCI